MSGTDLRKEMVSAGRLLWERNLVGATEGNLSCRFGGHVLCTPSGLRKGHLDKDDLVVIDHAGHTMEATRHRPSSEIKLHLRLYKLCPEVQAVVHAHPLTATAFATCGLTVPTEHLPEAVVVLGPVALVPFGMPGTEALPDALEPFARSHKTFLLANHGAVAVGRTLTEAVHRMETLERVAQIMMACRQLGEPARLSPGDLEVLRAMAESANYE